MDFLFAYKGRERDEETGLYYYRARYYDPVVGRFVSEDPLGFGAGDVNLSRYVGNRVTLDTDPTGLVARGHHIIPIKVVVALLADRKITDDAEAYLLGLYTGPTHPSHGSGTYGGITYHEYNDIVSERIEKFLEGKKTPLTAKDMEALVASVLKDNRVKQFIDAVDSVVVQPGPGYKLDPKQPPPINDTIEAGRKYFKIAPARLKGLVIGGALAGALLELAAIDNFAEAMDSIQFKNSYRWVLQDLNSGNLHGAQLHIFGSYRFPGVSHSMYDAILDSKAARLAPVFAKTMERYFPE